MKLVGVSGGSGSGKTTLSRRLRNQWGDSSCTVIYQDSYYIDRSSQFAGDGSLNFDHPDALDWDLMVKHLTLLKKGMPSDVPFYDFSTHTRSKKTQTVKPTEFIIVDGAVRFPDTLPYDVSQNLKIKDYITLAGGLKQGAASFAHVHRINPLNPLYATKLTDKPL